MRDEIIFFYETIQVYEANHCVLSSPKSLQLW